MSHPSTETEMRLIIEAQIASYQDDIEREEQQIERSQRKIEERRQKIWEWQNRLAGETEAAGAGVGESEGKE